MMTTVGETLRPSAEDTAALAFSRERAVVSCIFRKSRQSDWFSDRLLFIHLSRGGVK
eukprot:COSAG04_NODE_9933_length_819_cov_0.965278_2_plen_56_part_01